ncbi:MAG: alpha/beta hydrolase [Acidobacteriota bacterium]
MALFHRTFLLIVLAFAVACAPSPESPPAAVGADAAETPPPAPVDDVAVEPAAGAAAGTVIFESAAGVVASGVEKFDAYVFYLHGRIIEEKGRRPEHPEYGIYEYDRVLEALAAPGIAVISEARAPTDDIDAYAAGVVSQIGELFAAGVAPEAVTVVGFSKGGSITLLTSHQLGHDDVGFVVLAACGPWLDDIPLELRGRMLSIHEKSDPIGTCRPWVEPSLGSLFFHEVELEIGGSHGAFYTPHPDWVGQTLVWTGAPSVRSQMAVPERVDVDG